MDDKDNQQGNTTSVVTEAGEGRSSALDDLFESMASSATAAQAEMRAIFNAETFNASSSHSPMLQRGRHKEKTASAPEDETLTDKVMRIVGRR